MSNRIIKTLILVVICFLATRGCTPHTLDLLLYEPDHPKYKEAIVAINVEAAIKEDKKWDAAYRDSLNSLCYKTTKTVEKNRTEYKMPITYDICYYWRTPCNLSIIYSKGEINFYGFLLFYLKDYQELKIKTDSESITIKSLESWLDRNFFLINEDVAQSIQKSKSLAFEVAKVGKLVEIPIPPKGLEKIKEFLNPDKLTSEEKL